jgi:hypothetical protein
MPQSSIPAKAEGKTDSKFNFIVQFIWVNACPSKEMVKE